MLSEQTLQQFKSSLRGQLLFPGDAGYDQARTLHNGMIDKRPALIARCAGVADVIASVNFARENNVLLAVRGGGHNVAGLAVCDGGLMIDLSPMKGIRIDAQARRVRADGGCTWGEVNHDLQAFGLAAAGGFVSTTGVGGLTLGGGLGWLVRKHGLALDNLISADVVTADGRLLVASATGNEDLFWGIRGGGGNFGVITSFEIQAHPAGTVLAGLALHPLSAGRAPMRFWRDFEKTAPEEATNGAVLFNAPAELPLPPVLKAEPIVGLGGVYTGPLETGERVLAALRRFGPPAADIYQPMPYSAAQTMADFLFPRGLLNYWKSNYLKELSDGAIDTVLAYFAKAPSPRSLVILEHNGHGAMDRVADDATAFGHRNRPYNFLVISMWEDRSQSDANIAWTREFFAAMQPYFADGVYLNYLDLAHEGEDRVRAAYGSNYGRLVALKKKYDPANLFRLNQNILPAPAATTAA